jgi:hypothetical protein
MNFIHLASSTPKGELNTILRQRFGAEIQMAHINVPEYEVHIPDTGETGPLRAIVNTHWGMLYWEPMKRYFQNSGK